MDFRADLRALIDAALVALGYQPDATLTLHKLINLYFDALARRIKAAPRRILKARTFACPPAHSVGLAQLESAITSGADLTPHLSTRLDKLKFLDGMLAEWG